MSAVVEGLQADVVLQGGGVKGIGLVRALVALTDAGYRFNRISGTSAGAIVGPLAAAGLTGERLRQSALSLKYVKFKAPAPLESITPAARAWRYRKATASTRATNAHDGSVVSWPRSTSIPSATPRSTT